MTTHHAVAGAMDGLAGPSSYSAMDGLVWGTSCGKGGPTMAPWMARPDQPS